MSRHENHTIFIVDDDRDDRSFIKEAFLRNNFSGSFKCMGDGDKLMSFLQTSGVDENNNLILLDLNMPYKSGYQVLEEIKQDTALRSLPIMILTSSMRQEDELRCYNLGCEKYFQKPISMEGYDDLANNILSYL